MTNPTGSLLLELLEFVNPAFDTRKALFHVDTDVEADVDAILDSFRLQTVRRYFHQVYWWDETAAAVRANEAEPGLKLENVAAHSWHVADAVLLLAGRYEHLDADRALRLAVLHDKLEMYTGDFDPVGVNGKGNETHAFDRRAQARKSSLERRALGEYLSGLRCSVRAEQRALIKENIIASTDEARFVKAVDKLQALAFVHEKKGGFVSDEHLLFSLRYSSMSLMYFPDLSTHYMSLMRRFVQRIADYRGSGLADLVSSVNTRLHAEVAGGNFYGRKDRADREVRSR